MNSSIGAGKRVESIDVLRGLTILIMIFVNDVSGVAGTPGWMKHFSPSNGDGMTFVDVVFPAFLFIMGMAMPFSLGKRLEKGKTLGKTVRHILIRTVSLLVIGVYMVNADVAANGILSADLWILLMYIAVILAWNSPAGEQKLPSRRIIYGRWFGFFSLVVLAFLYRGPGEKALIELLPRWWGILGLIGWAYLIACLFYIPMRRHRYRLLLGILFLYLFAIADGLGMLGFLDCLRPWINFGYTWGSHSAIVLSGAFLGMMFTHDSPFQSHRSRLLLAALFGGGMTLAGFALHLLHDLHPAFIINKLQGTVPWCLLSSGATVGVWILIYWLIDMKGWKAWTRPLEPAGNHALFAYILAPMIAALFAVIFNLLSMNNLLEQLGNHFWPGFFRAVIFAFAMTWLAGQLPRLGIRLRL